MAVGKMENMENMESMRCMVGKLGKKRMWVEKTPDRQSNVKF